MRSALRSLGGLSFAFILSFMPTKAWAAIINVPADEPTIQAAIDAASNGDTVLVAPGTYYENINFMGKAITVTSSGGPSVTTINGNAAGTVVIFTNNEGNHSVLSGFTITNGNSYGNYENFGFTDYDGGGIYISYASPTITNNIVTQNRGCGNGGGIAVEYSSAVIRGNTISNNDQGGCSGGHGGGVYIKGAGSAQIIGNTISNNLWIGGWGGGIAIEYSATPTVENNTISDNTTTGISPENEGGGIYIYNSAPVIIQNLITGNSASVPGEASAGEGGGIYLESSAGSGALLMVNNTIAGNSGSAGSGIYADNYSAQTDLVNNVVVASPGQPAVFCGESSGEIPPIVRSTDAYSTGGNGFDGGCAGMAGSNGNISADPLFSNASSDFHLQAGSPAIDTGDNSAPGLPTTDFDGNPRNVDGNGDGSAVVDMGAYEFIPTTDTVSPTSLNFGSEFVGSTSPAQTVTVTNTGSQNLTLNIAVDPSFAETDNCGSPIAPGASCSINVTFTPNAAGTINGNLTIHSNALGSPQTVALSGTGAEPPVSLSPSSLNFGSMAVGYYNTINVTVTNDSAAVVTVSSVVVSGAYYSDSNFCTYSLSPGANCLIYVHFNPGAAGTWTGSLTVTDSASNSPQTATMTGSATGAAAILNPTSLAFGNQLVGTTSSPQTATLSNPGDATLTISSISATAGFGETNTCGSTLAVNTSCTISITFSPTTGGSQTGGVLVSDNSADSSEQEVSVSGTGTTSAASLSPTSLTFPGQQVGTTSAAQTVTLSNTGTGALTISSIATGGDFAQTNNCGSSVAAGSNCSINVTFTPTATGTRTGAITITDNASGSPQSVSLTGTGTAPTAALSPSSLNFGDQVVGTTSAAQSATLSNTGNAPLTISGITTAGDFAQTDNCGTTLGAGAHCSISLTFTPSTTGTRTGAVTVSSNSSGGPVSMALSGNGVENAPIFNPTSLVFSNQVVGSKSGGKNIKVTANGPGPLVISSISVTGDFLESNNCPASLNKGQSCNITINFMPTAGGPASGTIIVADNGLGSPQSIPVSGNGLDFTLSASPSSVSISAGQKAQYTVTATEVGGSFNNNVNLACSGLPAGAKCQFSPSGIAPKTGSANSALGIQTGGGTPSGSYPITITGTSGSLQHSAAVTLVVN
jgi:parallel beta-helix repeat protein